MKAVLSLLTIATLTASASIPLLANAPLEQDIDKTTAPLNRSKRESEETYVLNLSNVKIQITYEYNDKYTIDFYYLKKEEIINIPNWLKYDGTSSCRENWRFNCGLKSLNFKKNDIVWDELKRLKIITKNDKMFDKTEFIASNTHVKIVNQKDISTIKILFFKAEKDNLYWVKQQSQFNLVDSTKTTTWTRNDLLTVDGALNIAIANPNIDKVVFDNVLQPQTNKQWAINVKPEIAPRDHHLQVFFTLDGKPYTSEITVSMQAKIDAPAPIIKENLSDVIKFGDENNLGNILDNKDNTIISAITQTNPRIIDFSQLEITNKENNQATLTAKPDSTSCAGSVEVTYNVVPTTVVDLKIDLKPTSNQAIAAQDYVGQIDPSNITNPAQTFYYANSESKITLKKPTTSSIITGVIYGCDAQWNKTAQSINIDETNGITLDGSQLDTKNGKYVVELSDNLGHTNNFYLQIAPKQAITNYLDTDNCKQFEQWAKANGHDNIRGISARQLNNLFAASQTWPPQANGLENANSFEPKTANNNLPNNNKSVLTGWAIIGIIVGTLSGMLLLGWLVKKFVVTPLILEPIRKKKAKAFAEQTAKDIAQMKADEKEEQEKNKGGK